MTQSCLNLYCEADLPCSQSVNEAFSELFVASDMLTYSTVDEDSTAEIGSDPSGLPSHPSRDDWLPSRTAQLPHDSASEPLQFTDQHIKPN